MCQGFIKAAFCSKDHHLADKRLDEWGTILFGILDNCEPSVEVWFQRTALERGRLVNWLAE